MQNSHNRLASQLCPAQKRAGSQAGISPNSKQPKDSQLGRKCVSQNATDAGSSAIHMNSPRYNPPKVCNTLSDENQLIDKNKYNSKLIIENEEQGIEQILVSFL